MLCHQNALLSWHNVTLIFRIPRDSLGFTFCAHRTVAILCSDCVCRFPVEFELFLSLCELIKLLGESSLRFLESAATD